MVFFPVFYPENVIVAAKLPEQVTIFSVQGCWRGFYVKITEIWGEKWIVNYQPSFTRIT